MKFVNFFKTQFSYCERVITLLGLILIYDKQVQQNRIEQWSSWSVFDVFQNILKSAAKSAAESAPLFFSKRQRKRRSKPELQAAAQAPLIL